MLSGIIFNSMWQNNQLFFTEMLTVAKLAPTSSLSLPHNKTSVFTSVFKSEIGPSLIQLARFWTYYYGTCIHTLCQSFYPSMPSYRY